MSSIFIFVLLSLTSALYIKCIDADVVMLNTSGITSQAVSECGQSLTLTCTFKKNTSVIVWKLAKVISPIAICTPNYSTLNPAYDGQYKISFDKTRCISNLTVIQVTMEDNGRIIVCSDGSHTDSKIIAVRDYNLNLIGETNSGTIIAVSGCVSQDTDVSFKWMEIDTCTLNENQFAHKVRFRNTTSCSKDSVCGSDQLIHYTEEVIFSPSKNRLHHLKVIAVYGNESKAPDEVVVRNMTLKGAKHACDQDKPSTRNSIYIAAASGFGMTLLLFIMCVYIRSCIKRNVYNLTKDDRNYKVVFLALPTADAGAQ